MNNTAKQDTIQAFAKKLKDKSPELYEEFTIKFNNQTTFISTQGAKSMYRPNTFSQYRGSFQNVADLYMAGMSTLSTGYKLFKELHDNMDIQSGISFLNKNELDIAHLSRDLNPWLKMDAFQAIKSKDDRNDISLMCLARGIQIPNWENSKKYYLMNPTVFLLFIKGDRTKKLYDFWVNVYLYIKSKCKKTSPNTAHANDFMKYGSKFINSLGSEFISLVNDEKEYDKRFKDFVSKCKHEGGV